MVELFLSATFSATFPLSLSCAFLPTEMADSSVGVSGGFASEPIGVATTGTEWIQSDSTRSDSARRTGQSIGEQWPANEDPIGVRKAPKVASAKSAV